MPGWPHRAQTGLVAALKTVAVSAGRPCDYSGISWERIDAAGGVQWPCPADDPDIPLGGTPRLYTDLQFHRANRNRLIVERLNELDEELEKAVEAGDVAVFSKALGALLQAVRDHAVPHEPGSLDASDVILPAADSTLEEVRDLLSGDGLIPG